jgi:4-carboxymuconolactone decarboxylase
MPDTCAEKGLEVQKRIVGDETVEKLYASAPADQQHIQHLLSANCFGDYLTRTGIDIPTRELLTVNGRETQILLGFTPALLIYEWISA